MIYIGKSPCQCGKRPNFGFPDDSHPTCCAVCQKVGMVDIVKRLCRSNERPWEIPCPVKGNKRYDGFCTHCFSHLFPSHPKTAQIRKKSKELQVVSHITSKYDGFLHDKPLYVNLSGGCCLSKRRIDLRKLVNGTMLCIEIDESQHKGYCRIDERARYDDLFMDFSGKYIFIRYNPDKYSMNGVNKNPSFSTRMRALEVEIEKHVGRIKDGDNQELVEVHHLHYDLLFIS